MVESHWAPLGGKELRYQKQTWELTGTVDVLNSGETLAVGATQADDVRRRRANLYFGLDGQPHSLNPGNLGEQFEHLEQTDESTAIVVKKAGRTYRYELKRLAYE